MISGWFVRYLTGLWVVCGWFVGGLPGLQVVCGWFGWFVDGLGDLLVVWIVSSFTANAKIKSSLKLILNENVKGRNL